MIGERSIFSVDCDMWRRLVALNPLAALEFGFRFRFNPIPRIMICWFCVPKASAMIPLIFLFWTRTSLGHLICALCLCLVKSSTVSAHANAAMMVICPMIAGRGFSITDISMSSPGFDIHALPNLPLPLSCSSATITVPWSSGWFEFDSARDLAAS